MELSRRDFLTIAAVAAGSQLPGCVYKKLTQEPANFSSVEEYIKEHGTKFVDEFLVPWLRIPSVSADQDRKEDCRKSAEYLAEEWRRSGLETRLVSMEKGNPLVLAQKFVSTDKPTVLVYGHYDVQPIKHLDQWVVDGIQLDPFNPAVINGRVYARGATDDKGQIAAHALAVRYFAQKGRLPCNVKYIAEGNEEGGGAGIKDFIKQNPDLLACDAVIVSDTGTMVEGHPALTTSLKGLIVSKLRAERPEDLVDIIHASHDPKRNETLLDGYYDNVLTTELDPAAAKLFGEPTPEMGEVLQPEFGYSQLKHRWHRPTNSPLFLSYANPNPRKRGGKTVHIVVKGPNTPLHSGQFGGPVQEPALNLAHLLAGLKEEGLEYDIDMLNYGSREFSTSIQPEAHAQITFHRKLGNFSDLVERVARKYNLHPFFNKLFQAETVQHRRDYLSKATEEDHTPAAYLSYRIVPNQNGQRVHDSIQILIFRYDGVVETGNIVHDPFNTDVENQYAQAVMSGLKAGYRKNSVHLIGAGGSIPITLTFRDSLRAPVILAGFSSPTDNLHAPKESFPLENGLFAGARSMIYALENIGRLTAKGA